jgi:hypothetical protein
LRRGRFAREDDELRGSAHAYSSLSVAMAVQVHEADHRRLREVNSLPLGDFVQGFINVWQMDRSDVAHESADDFVVAHTAMQPAKEENELDASGKNCGQYDVPVGGHGVPLDVKEVKEVNDVKGRKGKNLPEPFRRWTRIGSALRLLYLLDFLNVIYFPRAAPEKMIGRLRD